MNIICQSLYYQCILDKFHFFKSPKTFRASGRALCLLTLEYISAYNMDNTILLYKYIGDMSNMSTNEISLILKANNIIKKNQKNQEIVGVYPNLYIPIS
jgi:hypothetical protein